MIEINVSFLSPDGTYRIEGEEIPIIDKYIYLGT